MPFDEPLAQQPERRARLQRLEVLCHAVDDDLVALEVLQDAPQLKGGERVARVDHTVRPVERAVARAQCCKGRAGRVVGATDADEHEGVRLRAQARGEALDLGDPLVRGPVVHVEPSERAGVALLAGLAAC